MVAGPVLGRDKQHEDLDGFAVQALEADAVVRDGDGADEPLDAGVLGVRDGDAAADAGRAEQLALENGPHHVVEVGFAEAARAVQAGRHFADHPFLVDGGQIGDDGFAHHEVRHTHDSDPPSLVGGFLGLQALVHARPAAGVRRWSWIFSL